MLRQRNFRHVLISIYFLIFFSSINLTAQNLLPDGSFEQTSEFDYSYPFDAFAFLPHWKASSYNFFDSTEITTPDLFISGEEVPPSTPPSFWNVTTGAAHGDNYVGLNNVATKDGTFLPETISSELSTPLETGAYYTLNLDYRNKGKDYLHQSPMFCIEEELKKLIFFFDDDPISISLNESDNISVPSSEYSIELHQPSMQEYQVMDWENIGTCFQATGEEEFIALSMPPGRLSVYPPCVIFDEHYDVFLNYYFDVDNIRLEKLPEEFNIKTTLCNNRPVNINLKDSLLLPSMLSPVYFSFNGNTTDDIINISSGGEYLAYAHLDCTTIPISIEVEEVDCSPKIYAPNVFSPNRDGINDYWQVFIKSDLPVTEFKMTIFDRWGARVFETHEPSNGWTGYRGDDLAPMGTYAWVLQYTYIDPDYGLKSKVESGDLILIR